ncbi:MAG: LruC domain-containing protein [Bacteroidota bacterium]
MRKSNLFTIVTILLFLVGCVSENDLDSTPVDDGIVVTDDDPLSGFNVSADFDYATSKQVDIILDVPDFLNGAVLGIYSKSGTLDSLAIGRASFDDNGHFEKSFTLTAQADSILLFSDYLGLTNEVRLPIIGQSATFDYRPLFERSETTDKHKILPKKTYAPLLSQVDYTYLDGFDGQGVPDNLVFPDVIAQNLLDDINASLPEYVPGGVPESHPEYLAGVETQLILTKEADVWVTFVAEGAGYRNGLGYYSYPLGQAPTSVDDITQHNIIFPNASMVGSGGGLIPGDRVYLGRFSANTVVSWFLVANGWQGNGVGDGTGIYYSDPNLNPESNTDLKTHMVLLYDEGRDLTLLGFEDLRRDVASDDDFNDAVFYARSNPVDAIQIGNLAQIQPAVDADGDGINDELDDFPFDPDKAFNNFAPSVNSVGKLVFEDLWPSQGDYDFNDLALDYSFNLIANSDNLVTSITASFTIEQIGGALHNGFGFVLPIAPTLVDSVDGQVLNGGYESVGANGTETGTAPDETVIFVVGDAFDLSGTTIDVSILLNTPMVASDLGNVPFNPFLIVNQDRAREVHLPDLTPTSKAGYLGTVDDYSDSIIGRYYKTENNLPWAINIYDNFITPPESVPIYLQYPRFTNWANSGGTQDLDWYIQ